MNVTIKDIAFLQSIQPSQITVYLQKNGWHQQKQILDKATIWRKQNTASEAIEIVLPLHQETPGFTVSMSIILDTLEKVENRSQLDIISELITNAVNITIRGVVMQIQTPNADKLSGEITLLGIVVDKLRKIQTELADRDYIKAIKAYQERLPIICTGDLIKENGHFNLKNSRYFAIDTEID
ncbi:hypothetical protein ACE1CI_31070 [Aerosakkonemataceae cyanobacterium BLCC-F50]|uniref:Uncharacterized protein n=1 Tax=Floridaenema flaviceps BLCC-F50 TaxID=3153642 RepID=A0ABV4Y0C7_9CYAN